jgi:hypothetical protein
MDLASAVAAAAGLAWASGLRLYAVLLIAGLLGRLGYIDLPTGLKVLEHPAVLAAAAFMFAVEFLADKIPAFDSLWDGVHTLIRVPAGAVLAALALAGQDPAIVTAAAILGGTLAAGTHAAKAGSRLMVNASPEPVSNWIASLGEDILVPAGLLTAFFHPVVFLLALAAFVLILAWLLPRLWRAASRAMRGPTGGKIVPDTRRI